MVDINFKCYLSYTRYNSFIVYRQKLFGLTGLSPLLSVWFGFFIISSGPHMSSDVNLCWMHSVFPHCHVVNDMQAGLLTSCIISTSVFSLNY